MRSILPHEPLPKEELGYINIQGSLTPKNNNAKQKEKESEISFQQNEIDITEMMDEISKKLMKSLSELSTSHNILAVDVFPCCNKAKLTCESPNAARDITSYLKGMKITPSDLLQTKDPENETKKYSTKALQINQLTNTSLPPTSWKYASPPKFRRLLPTPENSRQDDICDIEERRKTTRFVYISDLFSEEDPNSLNAYHSIIKSESVADEKGQDIILMDAIRNAIQQYDTSGYGIEVWLPNKKKKIGTAQYCYIGMRSHEDAERLITELQNQSIPLSFPSSTSSFTILQTQSLFLDWADVARKTYKHPNDESDANELKRLPSRSECTSTTAHIHIPGLAIIHDFIPSIQEEEVLLAAITGPNAPWAPKQKRQSGNEAVKRRVQHYGYVFDYATADVLRQCEPTSLDQGSGGGGGGGCPPLPAIPNKDIIKEDKDVENFISKTVKDLNGWETFAGIIERTRRTNFSSFINDNNKHNENTDEHKEAETNTSKNDQLRFPYINQVTINEYQPGQGIGSHIDTPSAFADGLISITLNGGCVMEFRKQIMDSNSSDAKNPSKPSYIKKLVFLPPRSALLMSGPARYEWEHMIVSRFTDTVDGVMIRRKLRVSITLRTALKLKDNNEDTPALPMDIIESHQFPPRWYRNAFINKSDKQNEDFTKDNGNKSEFNPLITPECEKNHVHAVYDAIAEQWHHTRGKRGVLWPGATEFLEGLDHGSIVADVGCGDGKYFAAGWNAGCYVIGTDISLPLLQTAMGGSGGADPRQVEYDKSIASAKPAMAVADCLNLPMRDGCCDAAICIAVMHHLSNENRRIQCLRELRRVVKKGGVINVQAWAMEQDEKSKRKFAGTDVFVPFNAQPRYLTKVQVEKKRDKKKKANDSIAARGVAEMYSEAYDGAEFDENKGLVVFKRYCHLYRYGELDALVEKVEGLSLIKSGYESGNHFVLLKVID